MDTQQMMNSFVRKRIMNSPLLQISSLGKNVFITKLPNLQKISLRHCGIKVSSFFTMTKMKTNDCFFFLMKTMKMVMESIPTMSMILIEILTLLLRQSTRALSTTSRSWWRSTSATTTSPTSGSRLSGENWRNPQKK